MKGQRIRMWDLFLAFFKISPITFGGGYAMIPMIEKEVVERRGWIEAKEMPEMLAVAGSAPGAIGVNTSIMVGYRIAGVRGALSALLGMMLPTFLIAVLLTVLLLRFYDSSVVKAAFKGIASAVVAMILFAGYRMAKTSIIDLTTLLIACLTVLLLLFFSVNPVWMILVGGAASFVYVTLKPLALRKFMHKTKTGMPASGKSKTRSHFS